MVSQITNNITYAQEVLQIVNTQLDSSSKEEIVELVVKLFSYGRHFGVNPNTYHKKNLLVTRGIDKSNTNSGNWIKVGLVDEKKLQRNKIEGVLVFCCEKGSNQSNWFVSFFHKGDWVDDLKQVVDDLESKCFSYIS